MICDLQTNLKGVVGAINPGFKTARECYQKKRKFRVEIMNVPTQGLRKGSMPVGFKHRKASFNNHDA